MLEFSFAPINKSMTHVSGWLLLVATREGLERVSHLTMDDYPFYYYDAKNAKEATSEHDLTVIHESLIMTGFKEEMVSPDGENTRYLYSFDIDGQSFKIFHALVSYMPTIAIELFSIGFSPQDKNHSMYDAFLYLYSENGKSISDTVLVGSAYGMSEHSFSALRNTSGKLTKEEKTLLIFGNTGVAMSIKSVDEKIKNKPDISNHIADW